jgi:hypothetical protein
MKSYEESYLVASDDDYGIYVMTANEVQQTKKSYWAYFFEGGRFVVIFPSIIGEFVKPSQLISCKNEYDEVLTGEALGAYIKEAIRAFKEELPRFNKYLDEHSDWTPEVS